MNFDCRLDGRWQSKAFCTICFIREEKKKDAVEFVVNRERFIRIVLTQYHSNS